MIFKNSNNRSLKTPIKFDKQSGFTMIEMALIVVVGGIILTYMGAALIAFMRENQIRTTEYRLDKIKESLNHYLSVNGRYPCAANRTLGPSDNFFGREVTSDCDTGAFAGTVRVDSAVIGERVRIGAVPTRTLNIPDDFLADAWGRKFKYAITEALATNLEYRSDRGRIVIRDDADATMVSDAHYIVVSHGVSGDGAFPLGASTIQTIDCPAAVGDTLDQRNCDDSDAIFRSTLVTADSAVVDFFDDYVAFQTRGSPLEFPTGAVIGFTTATCPVGWTDYIRADGAFIIGADADPLTLPQFAVRSTGSTSFNISVGSPNRKDVSIMPPSRALKYCEKLPQ